MQLTLTEHEREELIKTLRWATTTMGGPTLNATIKDILRRLQDSK